MKSIFNIFKALTKGDTIYSPIVGELTYEHVSSNEKGQKYIYGSTSISDLSNAKHIYMHCFDEFGRYIISSITENNGERMLFKNKAEFINYNYE